MRNLDSKIEKKYQSRERDYSSDIFHYYCYLGFKETQSALLFVYVTGLFSLLPRTPGFKQSSSQPPKQH